LSIAKGKDKSIALNIEIQGKNAKEKELFYEL
jgi:hypothetical protein